MRARLTRRALLSKYFLPPHRYPLAVLTGASGDQEYPLSSGNWGGWALGRRMLRQSQEVRQREESTENTASSQGGEGVFPEGFQGEAM